MIETAAQVSSCSNESRSRRLLLQRSSCERFGSHCSEDAHVPDILLPVSPEPPP